MRSSLRLAILTLLTLSAFAMNSLLGRAALLHGGIDAASFTTLRLGCGALVLLLLLRGKSPRRPKGNWQSACWLTVYALPFSFSYITLATGTGALILFSFVQATMVTSGIRSGEPMGWAKWLGLTTAFSGLVVLLLPGVVAPDPWGAVLMAASGIGWGMYSLRGKGTEDPLAETAGNFLRAFPLALPVWGLTLFWDAVHWSSWTVTLALISGGVTSGLGYALWYSVLPNLRSSTAATVQLTVPLLATIFGVITLGERLSLRFAVAATLILGGILLVISERSARSTTPKTSES